MSDDESKRAIPDTGFRLSPLIQEVLDGSDATDLDDLALEILGRIPSYDRETALFQAVRKLARPMFRPAFIPTPREAEQTRGVEPVGPSPARDGRQWVTADGRVADTREEVEASRVEETQVSVDTRAFAEAMEQERVASAIESEAVQAVADGALTEPQAEQVAATVYHGSWSDTDPRRTPSASNAPRGSFTHNYTRSTAPTAPRPLRPTPPPPPRPSQKVTAIREAWQRALAQRLAVGGGTYKFLRDCTVVDLERAADQREQHAKRTQARADQLRTLAGLMREHDARTLADVPSDVLSKMSETLTEAAAA